MASRNILAKMAVLIDGQTAAFDLKMAKSQKKLSGFGKAAKLAGGSVAGLFGGALVLRAFSSAISSIASFEAEMSKVRAITGATDKSFDRLRKNALDLGRSTKFTATQVASLNVEYGKLGFTTREILAASDATLQLATATGEDLAQSAKIAGATLRGFDLDALETGRVVDVMAKSFTSSASDLESFGETMKFLAPIAKAANVPIEEASALVSTLADAGIKGSQAGTALRRIFVDLTKTGIPLSKALDQVADAGIDLATSQDKVGRLAQTALLVLANNRVKTDELTESYENASGAAAEMARIVEDNLLGDITKLSSAYDGLIQKGGALNEFFRGTVKGATELVNVLNSGNISFLEKLSAFLGPGGKINAVLADVAANAKKANDELERQQRIIRTADAAFDFGDIEAYIRALDTQVDKEDIIAEIRRRQNEEAKKALALANEKALISEKEAKLLQEQARQAAKIAESEAKRTKSALARQVQALSRANNRADPNSPLIKRDFTGIDIGSVTKSLGDQIEPVNVKFNEFTENVLEGSQLVQESIAGLAVGIGESFADILTNTGDLDSFFNSILGAFGSFIKQFGKMMIAYGTAQAAFKKAFANPIAAIAAGTALVAIGSIIKKLSSKGPDIPALATGTNFIPQDGIYKLHKGETVTPKKFVPQNGMDRVDIKVEDILIDVDKIRIMLARSNKKLGRMQGI